MGKRSILPVLAIGVLLAVSSWGGEENCDEAVSRAERLWLNDGYEESNKVLDEAMELCPARAEVYWRRARNNYDILEHIPRDRKPGKVELIGRYREIEDLGRKCAEVDPEDGTCYVWQAIGMGRRGTTQGVLNSLRDVKDMEALLLRAIYLKPAYRAEGGRSSAMADACTALGMFYRVVPDWKFIEWVFGTRGDINKSVKLQSMAVELEPQRIEYVKELGISLMCRGERTGNQADIEEGKKHLEKVKDLPVIKPSDLIDKEHAKDLLADPGLACGYSRDAQQEVSQDAFDAEQEIK